MKMITVSPRSNGCATVAHPSLADNRPPNAILGLQDRIPCFDIWWDRKTGEARPAADQILTNFSDDRWVPLPAISVREYRPGWFTMEVPPYHWRRS